LSEEDRKLFGQEPTQATHYEYLFALPRDDETLTYITLLRPRDWLEKLEDSESVCEFETQSDTDKSESVICVWLDLPEMGTVGWAQLLAVNDKFEIQSGHGNIVTGTFTHLANNVIDLKIEGQEPIGCTDNHPFWSVDRRDYILAGKLQDGERILLYSGETKRVEQKLPRPGPELVYNIEVFGEHVYHVGQDGILVHNACNNPFGRRGSPAHQARIAQAETRFTKNGWKTDSGGKKSEIRVDIGNTGRHRYADLVLKKGGKTIVFQVGRTTKNGTPIPRELSALKDLKLHYKCHVFFLKY
jgi:hypothetical protein